MWLFCKNLNGLDLFKFFNFLKNSLNCFNHLFAKIVVFKLLFWLKNKKSIKLLNLSITLYLSYACLNLIKVLNYHKNLYKFYKFLLKT